MSSTPQAPSEAPMSSRLARSTLQLNAGKAASESATFAKLVKLERE
jgi:hypothetical protein